jgi:hypothetical protein
MFFCGGEKRRPCLQDAYVGHPKIAITSPFGTRRTRRRFTRYCRITHNNLNNYNGICRKGRLRPSDRLNSLRSRSSLTVARIQRSIRPQGRDNLLRRHEWKIRHTFFASAIKQQPERNTNDIWKQQRCHA